VSTNGQGHLATARAPVDIGRIARQIARDVAAPAAADVDAEARFPSETIEAFSEAGLLGALVPAAQGGCGATIAEVGDSVFAVAQHCASSAMILAMHHLQVACLARHGTTPALRSYLEEVAGLQLLLASATTEINIGGQLRVSSCAVEAVADGFRLEKQAPVVSYGAYADAVLVTARRRPDSAPNDQVLVLCASSRMSLEQTGEWNTLGMRGTCSTGFHLKAEGHLDHVLPVPFAQIAEQTMLPVSHVLWGFVYLGVAAAAVSKARHFVQAEARKRPGETPAGAGRLAELVVVYRQMEAMVRDAAGRYDRTPVGEGHRVSTALLFNALKVGASTAVIDVVTRAMAICGMAGYREDSPYSLGRLLRDAHGSVVMVNNERIIRDNAQLLLVDREDI
jgi:acyl-CoA dehydrogenase